MGAASFGKGIPVLVHRTVGEAGRAFLPDRFPEALANADRLGGGAEFDWGFMSEPGGLGYADKMA